METTTNRLPMTKSPLPLFLIFLGLLLTSVLTSRAQQLPPGDPQNMDPAITYANDAGIVAYISPVNLDCVENYPIVVELKNYGTNPLTSVKINWYLNNTAQPQYSWSGNLASGETTQVTLNPGMFFYAFNHNIWTSTLLPNNMTDENTGNNGKSFSGMFLDGPMMTLIGLPEDKITKVGGSALFRVQCYGPANFTWQVCTFPDTTWTDLSEDASFYPGGIHNDTLWISNALQSMDSNNYRCKGEICGGIKFSKSALLRIIEPVIIRLDTLYPSAGDEIIYSVKVRNFTNIGAVSLWFYYKNTALTFLSYLYVDPDALINNIPNVFPGWSAIGYSWINLTPATLADESILYQVKFQYVADTSILQWDSWSLHVCQLGDDDGAEVPVDMQNGYALNSADGISQNMEGTLHYDNNTATPLGNTAVMLKQGANTMHTGTTDAAGLFAFNNLPNDWYTFDAACSKPWGGVNASDALLILKQFVGLVQLTDLVLAAADVDGSGNINSIDALLTAKRFTGLSSSFPNGDWVFQKDTVFLQAGTSVTQSFKGIVYGDVNGSYNPVSKEKPSVFMNLEGETFADPGQTIQVPVFCKGDVSVGAVSLIVNLPEAVEKIEKVIVPKDADESGTLLYNVVDGQLFISWYSLSPLNLKRGDELLQISLKINQNITTEDLSLSLDPNSILADEDAITLDNVQLSSPKLLLANEGFWLWQNSPNPFNETTEIKYSIPEDALVSLKIYNVTGECLNMQSVQVKAGTHTYTVDSKSFSPGIYFYNLEAKGNSQVYQGQRRMVVVD